MQRMYPKQYRGLSDVTARDWNAVIPKESEMGQCTELTPLGSLPF